ncbi:hypothetical protein CHLRE_01g030200v5 [Chlamydomonas reinhardtii]|uniref:PPM-type phosphatase domain-containing protein n=1 Tax=Chlamydomonas reinhardtii TaxID=3055 RepID=A8HQG8_CHLRE|nr:uncharacterized protein CHLRE_01g030200v5 [Chlamydomonas reinhardtii]PNW88452.1 hypothetical protein CHLRE_01g030200v5 [Chlamydomonas reinhardtii]|eukprot:XP_001690048.1 protein phosphatase 2C-like protein [Chlamydomonas reinhardtii]
MGCGSSVPVEAVDQGDQQKQQQQQGGAAAKNGSAADKAATDAETQKAKTTRARRLSYISNDANGAAVNAPPGSAAPAAANPGGKSGNTRARRLSYVTNDPNASPGNLKLNGEGEGGDEQDMEGGDEPAVQGQLAPEEQERRTLRVNVACMSRAGREPGFKKTNQDNCFAFEKYITEDQSLFGAMDGHGPHGHLVSGYVKQHLPIILVNHLTLEKDVKKALSQGFCEVDRSLGNSRIDCEFSGSTAVVSYLKGKTLTTAWVGDSRGVMGRETKKGWEAVDLTNDHKPTAPEEKARILKANGRVERLVDEMGQPMGPYRVWLQYAWIPGLAMSRALGDVLAHQVGVTSEPDHSTMELTPQDKFIVLASDGVWEFISSKEAVDIVAQYESAEEACRQLVDEAYQRWLTEEEGVVDDITAVVVRFVHP